MGECEGEAMTTDLDAEVPPIEDPERSNREARAWLHFVGFDEPLTLRCLVLVLKALTPEQLTDLLGEATEEDSVTAWLCAYFKQEKERADRLEQIIGQLQAGSMKLELERAEKAEQRVREMQETEGNLRDRLQQMIAIAGSAQQERDTLRAALADMTMQRDVMCEKLNEYIDKTKEAEQRVRELEGVLGVTQTVRISPTADELRMWSEGLKIHALRSYRDRNNLDLPSAKRLFEECAAALVKK